MSRERTLFFIFFNKSFIKLYSFENWGVFCTVVYSLNIFCVFVTKMKQLLESSLIL